MLYIIYQNPKHESGQPLKNALKLMSVETL